MAALRRSLRRSRRLSLALIVLTFLGTGGSWHVGTDDPDCADLVTHDHSAHHERFGRTSAPAPTPSHCAICHWLQAFRSDAVRHARVQFAVAQSDAAPLGQFAPIRSGDPLDLPSRAPPLA